MPVNNVFCVIIEILVGVITGLDGSGFSGLPLVGSMAGTFSATTGFDTAVLAALGQITTVWVGGGTVLPWGVVPVAAICGISPAAVSYTHLSGTVRSVPSSVIFSWPTSSSSASISSREGTCFVSVEKPQARSTG